MIRLVADQHILKNVDVGNELTAETKRGFPLQTNA
jgi:hypothetical protein